MNKNMKFLMYAAGIFICYFIFGLIQEKVMRGKYTDSEGKSSEQFTYALFVVMVQCIINVIFAKTMLALNPQEADTTRTIYYFSSALTYLLAMVASNMALQYVNYPTQVVGKSAKPIPVMILGVLLGNKKYPLRRYLFVLLIVTGVVLFMYKEKQGAVQSSGYGLGELLLVLSLSMDGILGAIQERMRAESSPSALQMMISTNYWASIMLTVSAMISGELFAAVDFMSRYPIIIFQILLLAVTGALGQLFIFLCVSQYGPLSCSVVTTTRKFFTVLASVIIFGNVLSARRWFGAILVFVGLFLDMFYGKEKPKQLVKA